MQLNEMRKLRQDVCHIKLISQAKEILENRLKGKKNFATSEAYNVFVVSAFLLVKENIIKKDWNNDVLYFDYNDERYIPYILKLARKVKKSEYIRNNTTVTVQNSTESISSELENAIWIVNKIRDSLAHGVYEIKDNKIIIENDHTDEIVPYKLCCTLDIDDLSKFILSVVTDQKIDKNDIFKYLSPVLTKKVKNKECVAVFNGRRSQILVGEYKDYPRNFADKRRVLIGITSENDSYNLDIKDLKKLKKRLSSTPHLQRSLMYGLEKSYDLIDAASKEEALANKSINVINSLTDYFGSSDIDNIIDYIYLYNYMSLVFSLYDDQKTDVLNLDLTNFDMNINDTDYNNLQAKISQVVNGGINRIDNTIENYRNHRDVVPSVTISNSINSFYNKIAKKINSLNQMTIKFIRNGIEHANITEDNGLIKISDSANQNNGIERAVFTGTVNDYFELTSYVEKQKINAEEEYLRIDLLDNVLNHIQYHELIDILENAEAEINVSHNRVKCL